MAFTQDPLNPFVQKTAQLMLLAVAFGSIFAVFIHRLEPVPRLINTVMPLLNGFIHLSLYVGLCYMPRKVTTFLWISALSILGNMTAATWYFIVQALSTNGQLIATLPPIISVLIVVIVSMFVFARPRQVLITAIVFWILIALPILTYLIFHPDELISPRGLDVVIALGPVMPIIIVLVPFHKGIVQKLTALQDERARLQMLSEHDPLTHMYNRRGIENLFPDLMVASRTSMGVILFDIDHFKKINDLFGHNIGDVVLGQVAQRCKSILRKDDLVARWGGEEFLVFIQGVNSETLWTIADDLRKEISSEPIGPIAKVTASFGITHWKETDSTESLIHRVDQAMYAAKQQGRDRIVSG